MDVLGNLFLDLRLVLSYFFLLLSSLKIDSLDAKDACALVFNNPLALTNSFFVCQASKKCEVKEQCGGKDYVSWLDRDQTCPEPQITSFRHLMRFKFIGADTLYLTRDCIVKRCAFARHIIIIRMSLIAY